MKIRSVKSSLVKTTIVLVCITLFLAGGWLIYAQQYQKWPYLPAQPQAQPITTPAVSYSEPSPSQTREGSNIKQQAAENRDNEAESTQKGISIPVTITSVRPGPIVYIRAVIGVVSTDATCNLSMTGPDNKTYAATAEVQAMATSSTCKGFNIPMSELASGLWHITISVTNGSATGRATTEETL